MLSQINLSWGREKSTYRPCPKSTWASSLEPSRWHSSLPWLECDLPSLSWWSKYPSARAPWLHWHPTVEATGQKRWSLEGSHNQPSWDSPKATCFASFSWPLSGKRWTHGCLAFDRRYGHQIGWKSWNRISKPRTKATLQGLDKPVQSPESCWQH